MATDVQQYEDSEQYDEEEEDQAQDDTQEYDDDDQDQDEENESEGDQNDESSAGPDGPKYIRLRGLPWSATHQEILDFLKKINVVNGAKGIHLITSRWDGKNTGEAYVELQGQADIEEARKLNKAMMGHRYIEVFTANPKEAKDALRKTSGHGNSYVVKLRGLPYAVTEQQIEEFFNGLEIKPEREGILFVMDRRGRATGEAFVQFESPEDTEQALGRNREKIGHRYIEIFRSSLAELKRASTGNGRPGPYDLKDRGGNRGNDFGGGRNNMRGGGNDWGNGGFGIGANNTLGFGSLAAFTNSGNFGNGFGDGGNFGGNGNGNFGNNGGGLGGNFGNNGGGVGGNFGNNGVGLGGNFGNNGGNFGNGNGNGFGGNNRFNNGNGNGNDSFSNDFGDFGNFGNRNFNNGGGPNNFGGNGGNNGNGNFGNFGNNGGGNMGNGGGMGGNMGGGNFNSNMGGGNFGPIGGGRVDTEYFTVHMRGLPYSCFENDVFKFFDPIRPANVRINFNKKGLHSGTADVFFESHEDSQLAMKRHREQMGSRYIELFFDGKTKGGSNNGGGGGIGNNNNSNFSRRI